MTKRRFERSKEKGIYHIEGPLHPPASVYHKDVCGFSAETLKLVERGKIYSKY